MFKKFTALFVSLVLLLSFSVSAHAAQKSVSIWIDGKQVEFSGAEPYIVDGTTLAPAQFMFEQLGFEVSLDEEKGTVTGTKEEVSIAFESNSKKVVINEQELELLVSTALVGDTLYAPVRLIAELGSYKVTWDHDNSAVQLAFKEGSKGFLWKTEHAGNTVYLLGSIHVASEDMYPLHKSIRDAYRDSDYVAVEVDLTDEELQLESLLEEVGAYKDGTTLKDHVSADTYERLGVILEQLGLEKNTYDSYKPWVVSSSLDSVVMMMEGYSSLLGIDLHFMSHAKYDGLPILGLETLDFQLEMFNSLLEKDQEQLLIESIDTFYNGADEEFETLVEMFMTGDDSILENVIAEMAKDEAGYKIMVVDRNKAMTEKIDGYLKGTEGATYFVIVGAAHMLGPDGIVPLLEGKGYKVERQ